MNLEAVPIGKNAPHDVNVVIEVPIGGEPIKYEMDKASGALVVDRFLYTSMRYPGNYGFIPHTLSGDGDPVRRDRRQYARDRSRRRHELQDRRRSADGGRARRRREAARRAVGQAHPALRACAQLLRLALDHPRADRALLRSLQGSRAEQMGQDHPLGRRRRGAQAGHRRNRAGQAGEGLRRTAPPLLRVASPGRLPRAEPAAPPFAQASGNQQAARRRCSSIVSRSGASVRQRARAKTQRFA